MTQNNNVDIENLAAEVEQLLQQANAELLEQQQQQARQIKIDQIADSLRTRIQNLLDQIRPVLQQYEEGSLSTPTSLQLQQHLDRLSEMAESAQQIAALQVDAVMWQEQAALMLSHRVEEIRLYREQVQSDILDRINAANDFWEATDLAILVRQHADDLTEIDGLNPIVELLIDRINELDQIPREKPIAFLRGTHRSTLNFIAEQALKNRENVGGSRGRREVPSISPDIVPPQVNRLADLKGKVVLFGGHDRLVASLRQQLPNVTLVCATVQGGNGQVSKAQEQVATADVVVIMTAYINHTADSRAKQACAAHGKTPVMVNSNGLTRCLQQIEESLLSQKQESSKSNRR